MGSRLRGAHRKTTSVGEQIQDAQVMAACPEQREVSGHMIAQNPAAIIPLIEKQPDRVTFAKTYNELQSVLPKNELSRCVLAEDFLGRSPVRTPTGNVSDKFPMICSMRMVFLNQLL